MSEPACAPPNPAPAFLRWLLRAVAMGFLGSFPITLLLNHFQLRQALFAGLVGTVFSVIMWAGCELGSPWLRRLSRRSMAWGQICWLLLYSGLFLTTLGAVRLLLGLNLMRSPGSCLVTFLIGYAISSSIISYHLSKDLIQAERALEMARGQAQLQTLKAQLSPHTLFNALNTIAALIPEDPAGAEAAVEDLSRFLRQVLAALERERWTLAEEFQLLAFLLGLEQARFGTRLRFQLELPDSEAEQLIPPLLLLPLVENSLKHGFRPKLGPCALSVRASQGRIRIQDDGVGMAAQPGAGLGLTAVASRLQALGGSLSWPATESGCIVELRLCP